MKSVLARKEGAGCWRVLLTHMPLYNDNVWNSEPCRQMWEPVLARAAIDLEFSGHDHTWKLLPKGKTYEIERCLALASLHHFVRWKVTSFAEP